MRYSRLHLAAERDGAVRRVVLSGQPLGSQEAREIVAATEAMLEDRSIRVVVIESSADSFCPGPADDLDFLAPGPDPAATIARLRPPVVVAVDGRCASVGLEIALAGDIRLATERSTFSLDDAVTGARLPSWGGTQRLPRCVGPSVATEMVLLGTALDAPQARRHGLLAAIAPSTTALRDAVEHTIDQLISAGPLALELAKEAVHRGAELPLRDGLRLEGDLNHLLQPTHDRAEALAAFFAKRPPDFAGR